ncbi:MAG: glycine cleavage system protein GcvH [Prevotellaceae bacterium]|jgi:glycine cleavage system H protein|nr:glycine cleavage system protein GcvH [Prevotellaceae bacterium]
MNIPRELKYSKEHEWVSFADGIAAVGITDYAQSQLGDIVFVDITSEGETLACGDEFGAIEAVKAVAPAYMPVSGKIVEKNGELDAAPESVNKDPYGAGWMIKIEVDDVSELDDLMDADQYAEYTA